MNRQEKREKKKRDRGIVDFLMMQNHFFPDFKKWIEEMLDPRHPSYTIYTQKDLVYMGILKNICSIESMRQMDEKFNEDTCIKTMQKMTGNQKLEEMPHYDTLNYYLERLSPECMSVLRKKMVTSLIRGKQFYRGRLLGTYWKVILDGTGVSYFTEKHCENCLKENKVLRDGRTITVYYHKVLEAKLVLSDRIVVSLGTEFIENESEQVEKQDCEMNAAKRLVARLKKEYPRLPICLQGDGLYATEPMMEICRLNNWKYIFSHKLQRLVAESYDLLTEAEGKIELDGIGAEKGKGAFYNHVDELAGKTEKMHVYEYNYVKKVKGEDKELHFQWITNIELTKRNLSEMIAAGRGRWKIENEGFNNQKNGLYQIQHLNSRNSNAMKNHYLLTQIADILMQLYVVWNPIIKEIKQSIKNTSSRLLESFRRQIHYIERYTTVYLE